MKQAIETLASYNYLWSEGKIKRPLNIMIGGNIGTGKSTFAKLITEHLQHINVLPTGIVRAVLQSLNLQTQIPELYGHSYQIGQHIDNPELSEKDKVILAFDRQSAVIDAAIRKILEFSQSEGQQYILDGNHVKAKTVAELRSCWCLFSNK